METSTLISLLGSAFSVVTAAVGISYAYGRLGAKLESLGETVEKGFDELKKSRDKAGERLGLVETGIVRLEAEVFRETTQRYNIPQRYRRRDNESDGNE